MRKIDRIVLLPIHIYVPTYSFAYNNKKLWQLNKTKAYSIKKISSERDALGRFEFISQGNIINAEKLIC